MTRGHAETHHPVAIVGAGPTGLVLALGLARHGVRSVLLERQAGTGAESRAAGIHVRTREILGQWRVEDAVRKAGFLRSSLALHDAATGRRLMAIDFSELDDEVDDPGMLFLEQSETERLLLDAVRDSGLCEIRFGSEVVALTHRPKNVELHVRTGAEEQALAADFAVGCDGAGSVVREAVSLPFDGITYSVRPTLADVRVRDERDRLPWPRLCNRKTGLSFTFRLAPHLWRIVALERSEPGGDRVDHAWLRDRVRELLGAGRSRRYGPAGFGFIAAPPPRSASGVCCWPAMPPTCTALSVVRA
jgi:2-polyprenyl-6-methoxyphenol hydroxylase-like FAD-dependent oxidoreductase